MHNRHFKTRGLVLALMSGLLAAPGLALATPLQNYVAMLMSPGSSMGSGGMGMGMGMGSGSMSMGTARFQLNPNTNMLTVWINASGLVPNQYHPQHIHESSNGQPDMSPALGLTVNPGDDPTLLASYPYVGTNGTLAFEQTYNLTDTGLYFSGFDESNLLPLTNDFIMLHGVDSATGVYEPDTMAAMGAIHAVPEPSSIFDMLAGLGALLALVGIRRRRLRHREAH